MIVEIDVVGLVNAAAIVDVSPGCGGSSGGGGGRSGDSDGGSGGSVRGYGVIVDAVASRRTRHPVAGARVARRRRYHGRVVIAVGIDIGGRRTLRRLLMTRQPLLLLLAEHLVGKILNQGERLPSLVAHQTHGGFLDDAVQQHQVLVLESLLFGSDKVIPQVIFKFGALLSYIREVDEESRTHVSLEGLDIIRLRRFIHLHQQIAVLEQTAAAYLFGMPRRDKLLVEMVERLLEITVDGLAHHGRVKVLGDRQLAAFVEQQQRVENDLEGIDGELELSPHRVDELELDVPVTPGIAEGDQRPSVTIVVHLHHLAHIGLLQAARGDAFATHALRQQVEQGAEHRGLDLVVITAARQLDREDKVQVVVGLGFGGQHVGGGAAVQPDIAYPHAGAPVARIGL
ncbi:unnamed protein product [Lasius platythorax]|uniref:Uncharacterized protein n=1 Tax=Lasius platythorax TaxID=488582 RepID=A0AAV2NXV9_9HYME